MPAALLSGKQLASTLQAETAAAVADFAQKHGSRPGLAAVLVGDNPASQIYVRNKRQACEKAGLASWLHHLPGETSQVQLHNLLSLTSGCGGLQNLFHRHPWEARHEHHVPVIHQAEWLGNRDPDRSLRVERGQGMPGLRRFRPWRINLAAHWLWTPLLVHRARAFRWVRYILNHTSSVGTVAQDLDLGAGL